MNNQKIGVLLIGLSLISMLIGISKLIQAENIKPDYTSYNELTDYYQYKQFQLQYDQCSTQENGKVPKFEANLSMSYGFLVVRCNWP